MKVAEVIVYVEGPSDKSAMEALLNPLLQQKRKEGVIIKFFEAPRGDKKESVLMKVPRRAVNIIRNKRDSVVVAMPYLYPRNKGFKHETFDELKTGIHKNFDDALRNKGVEDDHRLKERFQVFCFKYDLEVLILAAEEALKKRLGVELLDITWQIPVEDQNHDNPPRQIVEKLFEQQGGSYQGTDDAPLILGESNYQDIADKCPQCFKPFVDFLTDLQPTGYRDQHD